MPDGLDSPAGRVRFLAGIAPGDAAAHHAALRDVLAREVTWRRQGGGDHEHTENLYHCAFLLHLVGDPADVPALYDAKHTDFDTACGFDVEFLVGAGARETLAYLRENGHAAMAENLAGYPEIFDDLTEWRLGREEYFAG